MFLKKKVFAFVFFILLILATFIYQGIKGNEDTSVINILVYPLNILERGSFSISKGIKNLFKDYILLGDKKEENKKLIAKIERLEHEKNKLIEAVSENERLRELLELKSTRTDYITTAEVFARDPTNWFQILWINKGAENGIYKDMVAVTPSGLVGRIHRVLKDTASIILITDANSSVAVRFQSTRREGILEGYGMNRCRVKYIPLDEDVKEGEMVITSGLDGIYPEGIQIGYVSKVAKKGQGLFQHIEVIPMQHLEKIEEVAILKSRNSHKILPEK